MGLLKVIDLAVTVVGLGIAIWQIWKMRKIVKETQAQVRDRVMRTDMSYPIFLTRELMRFLEQDNAELARLRAVDLLQSISSLKRYESGELDPLRNGHEYLVTLPSTLSSMVEMDVDSRQKKVKFYRQKLSELFSQLNEEQSRSLYEF